MIEFLKRKIKKVISVIESSPISLSLWLISFFGVILTRFFVEFFLFGFGDDFEKNFSVVFFQGFFTFFLLLFLLFLLFLRTVTRESVKKISNFLLFGLWLLIFPPIIDRLIFGNQIFANFYIFDNFKGVVVRFFLFFGDNPDFGITYGARICIFVSMLAFGLYVHFKKKKIIWFLVGLVGSYILFFITSSLPSFITFVIGVVGGNYDLLFYKHEVAKIFATPLGFFGNEKGGFEHSLHVKMALFYNFFIFGLLVSLQWLVNKEKLKIFFLNVRFLQITVAVASFLFGVAFGFLNYPNNFNFDLFSVLVILNLVLAIVLTWVSTVAVNDLSDVKIDKISNQNRPLTKGEMSRKEFFNRALVLFFLSLLFSFAVDFRFFLFILFYHFLSWMYSCHPFRLRRFIVVSSVVASFATLLFFMMGYLLITDNYSLELFPWRLFLFVLVFCVFIIPIKDIKDIKGDKRFNVKTIPNLLGEENARIFFGVVLVIGYFFSSIIIEEKRLFLFSLLLGAASYFLVNNKKIKRKKLAWSLLGIIVLYVIISMLVIF